MAKGRGIKSHKEKRTVVSNKKKDRDQFKKEMDMILLKNKIGEIIKKVSDEKKKIENYNDKYKKNIEIMNEKYTDNSLYQTMFQNYMKNEYTLICISFINKIIINTKNNHLEEYEGKYNFNKIFTNMAKELFLNQYELILLSLYLEYINISLYSHIFGFEESLLFLCFFIKKMTLDNNELYPILDHLNKKYENFQINYEKWYKINENKFNEKTHFHHKEVNKRFRDYNNTFNEYCGENFIDYNYIVDRILTMSLPYADIRKDNFNENEKNNNIKETGLEDMNKLKDNNKILNFIPNKNIGDYQNNNNKNSNLIKPEFNNLNNNNILNKSKVIESQNNIKFNINNNTRIFQNITPNNLLHSLGKNNKIRQNQLNNKILVSNSNILNNSNNADINNQNSMNKSMHNNLIFNPIQTPSQSSLIYQQKPPFIDIFEKSHIFEEGETLRQILKNSNDNEFMKSSQSFDSQKFQYEIFLSNNNLGNNNKNIHNTNNNINNENAQKKYKSSDVPFKPLKIIYNKNFYRNIINYPNIVYNNNYENNNKSNNVPSNMNDK